MWVGLGVGEGDGEGGDTGDDPEPDPGALAHPTDTSISTAIARRLIRAPFFLRRDCAS
jgi:hypothetical protein